MKNLAKEHKSLLWLLTGVFLAVLIGGVNLYRPRDIRISGRIESFQKKQSIDLRLMFFDTEAGANVVRTVEYDNVMTTSDGRFDLIYTTSLASLPNQSYAQLCVRNVSDKDWNNTIPVCVEETEIATPARVQGARSDEQTVVSCVRKRIDGSLFGLASLFLGTTPEKYEFESYCSDVYTKTEYETVVSRTTELSKVDLESSGKTFITADGNLTEQAGLQLLSIEGSKLSISGGNTVKLPIPAYIDNDNQELSFENGVLVISGGNSVTLPQTPSPQPFTVLYGAGLSGSSSVNNGGSLSINNVGVLDVTGSGVINSSGGQNPNISLSLCANGEVLQVTGSVWTCNTAAGTYTFSLTDGVITQGIASGDSITFLSGNGLQSSVSAVDTVTYSISVGGVGTNEIADGSVANVDLANSNLTINAGSGLNGGGSVSLGGSVLLSNAGILSIGSSGPVTVSGGQNPTIALAACAGTEILKYDAGSSSWVCGTDIDTDTDAQSISVASDILSISGNASTVDLSAYLDDTDAQNLSLLGNTLSLVNGGSVDLSPYLDNTDAQDLSLSANTLSLTGDGTSVDLSGYLDDTTLNEAAVDAFVTNNGYLTVEVDGSISNELQDLTFASNVLGLTSSGVTFDLSGYLDNTDNQDLTLSGNTLAISNDPNTNVSLSGYLDNTDAQSIAVASDILSISGNASTVDLSVYLDNTDAQTISYAPGTQLLSISGGNSADLSSLLDNTDTQDLSLTGNTLSVTGDPNTDVDLSGYLDNTDTLASLSCGGGDVAQWNGSAWVCVVVSGTDSQTLSLVTDTLSISNGNSVDLTAYLDNTDNQSISVSTNILSISGNASTVDLSPYIDNFSIFDGTNTQNLVDGDTVTFAAGAGLTVLVSATDTVTYTSTLGAAIDNTEISNGTILFEDLNSNGCTAGQTAQFNGSAWVCGSGFTISDGANTQTILGSDTLQFTAGAGVTVLVGATDTVTIASVLGISIDTTEIEDGTIGAADLGTDSVTTVKIATDAVTTTEILDATLAFADIAQNSCTGGQVIGWDNTTFSWACTNPTGPTGQFYSSQTTNVNTAGYTAIPLDNETLKENGITHSNVTNNTRVTLEKAGNYFISYSVSWAGDASRKTIECGVRINGTTMVTPSLSYGYSRNTTDVNATSSSSALVTTAADNDYYEIVCRQAGSAGTANLVANQSWTIVSSTSTGLAGSESGVYAFDITDGTNSQVINANDAVTFATGAGLSVLVSATDTVTFSSDLGSTIESSEITDGNVANIDLANSAVTITSGGGLTGGGLLSLGGTLTLDIGAGNGVNVNANDIGLDVLTTGTTATTSSNSGLEVGADGLRLLGGCADGEALVWNSTTSQWVCGGLGAPTLQGYLAFGFVNGTTGTLTSGNGATISRTTTGSYTVTFDTAAADANYIVTLSAEENRTTRDDINITLDNQTATGFDVTVREGDNGGTADVLVDKNWYFQVLASDGVAGGGSGISSFNLSDGANTEVIDPGNTLTLTTGSGLTFLVSATDTATVSIDAGGITNTEILDGTILLGDIGANGCTNGQVMEFNGSAWICGSNDSVIGNEILDVAAASGLVRTGLGTSASPYNVGLITTCADREVLAWNTAGSSWGCTAAASVNDLIVLGNSLSTDMNTLATNNLMAWNIQPIGTTNATVLSHSVTVNNSRITTGTTGKYRFSGGISLSNTVTSNFRYNGIVKIRKNGTTFETGSYRTGYIRQASGQTETTLTFDFIVNATAGDYYEILIDRENTTAGSANLIPNASVLNAVFLRK